jgi:hypothetical protein
MHMERGENMRTELELVEERMALSRDAYRGKKSGKNFRLHSVLGQNSPPTLDLHKNAIPFYDKKLLPSSSILIKKPGRRRSESGRFDFPPSVPRALPAPPFRHEANRLGERDWKR